MLFDPIIVKLPSKLPPFGENEPGNLAASRIPIEIDQSVKVNEKPQIYEGVCVFESARL